MGPETFRRSYGVQMMSREQSRIESILSMNLMKTECLQIQRRIEVALQSKSEVSGIEKSARE